MASCADAIVRWQPVIGDVNMKSRIIEQLGKTDILVPSLITEGLTANDRVKARMSALQAPAERVHSRPSVAPPLTPRAPSGRPPAPTRVILLRPDTNTTDVAGFAASVGNGDRRPHRLPPWSRDNWGRGRRDVAIGRPDAELVEFERWRAAAETASR
jgi:hypothetical protein